MEKKRRRPEDYADIIDLPHFESRRYPRMSMEKRAAQFSPFAALTGYEDAVEDAVREAEKNGEKQ